MGMAPFIASRAITTWDELTKIFLARFFPPNKMASITFAQREDESLYKAWEQFKDLL